MNHSLLIGFDKHAAIIFSADGQRVEIADLLFECHLVPLSLKALAYRGKMLAEEILESET